MKIDKEKFKAKATRAVKRKSNWYLTFPAIVVGATQANFGLLNDVFTKEQFGLIAFVLGSIKFIVDWYQKRPDDKCKEERNDPSV